MALPLLQIALDDTVLENALSTAKAVADGVDIIEAGTILCVSEGVRTVSLLRSLYKDKIIVCDLKVADAGDVLARKAFGAGASYMTVICAAPIATMVAARQRWLMTTAERFRLNSLAHGPLMMPGSGLIMAYVRLYITVAVMLKDQASHGAVKILIK